MFRIKTLLAVGLMGSMTGLGTAAAIAAEPVSDSTIEASSVVEPAAEIAPAATDVPLTDGLEPAATFEAEPATETAADALSCPPGQFPSAFADVYPFHWAYQAINNLASPSMQCFDLPEEYR